MAWRSSPGSGGMDDDVIDVMSSSSSEDAPPQPPLRREPVVVKGVGHITMFGLNSRFETEFPAVLTGRVAPEEYQATLARINYVLRRHIATSGRWLLCGLLFCCCSFGCSLWPVVCLNKRTVTAVEKRLDAENSALYHRLGLHWQLARRSAPHRLAEYCLLLETLPRAPLLLPD